MKTFKFCPWCRGKLKVGRQISECTQCHKRLYRNSLPTGSVFIVKDQQVLLAKRAIPPDVGKYDVIGGFLAEGELPELGALREVKEETGVNVKILDLLGFYTNNDYRHQGEVYTTLDIFFVGEITGGKLKPADDVGSLHWFPIDKIPSPNQYAFKTVYRGLKDLQKWSSKNKNGF